MPYRVYMELGREELKNVNRGITMLNHSKKEPMRLLKDVLCQVGVTTIIAKFLILDMPIERDTPIIVEGGFVYTCGSILNTIERITSTFDEICHQTFRAAKTSLDTAKSDSDDEEEYVVQINKFGALIYGPKPAQYLNCNDPMDRSLALQAVLNPFKKVCVWKKVISFLGSLPVPLQHVEWKPNYTRCFNKKGDGDGQWHAEIKLTDPYGNTMGAHDDESGSSRSKRFRQYETVEERMLPRVHHPFLLWEGCNQAARSRYNTKLAQLLHRLIHSPCVVDWNVLNNIGCGEAIDEMLMIKLFVAGTNEEIFTSEAWTNAFNIDEPIYSELCHEFYSIYKFDEICAADELNPKKIIKFRLCDVLLVGRCWSLQREENLSLSRSHPSTIQNPVLRVLYKMITYGLCQRMTGYDKIHKNDLGLLSMFDARNQNGYANVAWLIARWMKRKGAGSQKESMIYYGQFIIKISKKRNLLSEEVLNDLSAQIYYRAFDTTTLKELIDFEGRLIHEAPAPDVPRVAIPRPPRASMPDLYEMMGNMEIHKGAIERMSYRKSYHWDMYARVFEHMIGVYSVLLQGPYNPPGYDQQQYDQYYQQYPPQQQQQPDDDDE
ncbi:hypothetical protein Tco_0931053 [Tanacetum coccineum]